MKGTTACDKRHDLLERAGADGDARVLAVLKTMKNARGCGFASMRDCWPCMRKDDALDDAVKAIDARTSKSPN